MIFPSKEVFALFSKCLQIVTMLALGILNIFSPFSFSVSHFKSDQYFKFLWFLFFSSLEATTDISHENKIQETLILLEWNLELVKNMSLYNNLNLLDCNTQVYWGLVLLELNMNSTPQRHLRKVSNQVLL